jgi:hypothetical protein
VAKVSLFVSKRSSCTHQFSGPSSLTRRKRMIGI